MLNLQTYLCGHVEYLALLGLDDLLERLVGHGGALSHLVQLGHVSSVVLLVVEGHSLLRDVRSQSVLSVGERGESEGHLRQKPTVLAPLVGSGSFAQANRESHRLWTKFRANFTELLPPTKIGSIGTDAYI